MKLRSTGLGRFAWLALVLLSSSNVVAQAPDARGEYTLPFGANPFSPSQAQASFAGFLSPSDFPPASYCGKCHQGIHAQWRESAHSNSFREPFYIKNVQMLTDAKGIEFTRHCEGCHNPVALFSGALTKGSKVDRAFDDDGITCSVCHSIEKVQSTSGTGSYVIGKPAVMVDKEGKPVPGRPSYYEILDHPEQHRQAVMRPFYRTPEFCSVCHKAAVPKSLNGSRWLRMFAVYDEWQNSSWAKESPLPFYKKDTVSTCQNCHMPVEPVENDYTEATGKARSHRWLGANTAIPVVYDYQEQLARTTQYLKTALKVDIFGLEQQPRQPVVAPLGATKVHLHPGETLTADVLITNSGAGHNLVPEQRDFYECWIEFTAADSSRRVFFHSGGLDTKGFLDPAAHSYTNRMLSPDGALLDMHQVWQTRLRAYDNTIPSGRTDLVRYRFHIPPDVKGEITLTARVNYRRFRRGFSNFVFPDQREFPVVNMASASVALAMGGTLPAAGNGDKATMLRWNNYGIALLGQQQYGAAEEAFRKVIAIDPEYADGYINMALAQFSAAVPNKKEAPDGVGNLATSSVSAQELGPAIKLLDKALVLRPNDPRALYYKGLVLRHQGKTQEAIAQQIKVVNAFPRSRQARQELGFAYYMEGQLDPAREQFEQLRDINPDDLTAHLYLSIIYSKLGMKEKAAEEGAAYSEHREDPTTGSMAQDFWRKNPMIVNELAPYHVHESSANAPKPSTVGGSLP